MDTLEITKIFYEKGLVMGRMISASKGDYIQRNPTHVSVFNANIVTITDGKIWYGDLDVTKSANILKEIAKEIGEPIFVLREMDARFENEDKVSSELIKKAVWNTSELVPYREIKND